MLACRSCGAELQRTFVDLGTTPLANSYLEASQLDGPEPRYPLHARVCESCLLVQVEDVVPPEEIFSDYAYASSYSASWVEHARRFAHHAIERFGLGPSSLVVEVASNDGYLLQHFRDEGIPILGVEPAANLAAVAVEAGIPTEVRFFGAETAADLVARGQQADLVVGNNVLAHVPDLNDFVSGIATLLGPDGVVSIEVPHLLRLIEDVQFDTIYHEHFSYFSLYAAERAFERHGLRIFDVEQLPTHGGSLRLSGCHAAHSRHDGSGLEGVRKAEHDAGLDCIDGYDGFAPRVEHCRRSVLQFLEGARAEGKRVVAYGAAAKGNTLLNFCGVTADAGVIDYVVDRSPHKQGRFLPGSRLPIEDPSRVAETKPDYLLILPWNLREEIVGQMKQITTWGGRFATPVPEVRVFS
ncbi:MAG TPA: class I SAM-dependent methyltransferase [Acidimicrobiales bacterium]|nr:class I SAM-dependent methyltransferase [Acidimicrobiales bacterium]